MRPCHAGEVLQGEGSGGAEDLMDSRGACSHGEVRACASFLPDRGYSLRDSTIVIGNLTRKLQILIAI